MSLSAIGTSAAPSDFATRTTQPRIPIFVVVRPSLPPPHRKGRSVRAKLCTFYERTTEISPFSHFHSKRERWSEWKDDGRGWLKGRIAIDIWRIFPLLLFFQEENFFAVKRFYSLSSPLSHNSALSRIICSAKSLGSALDVGQKKRWCVIAKSLFLSGCGLVIGKQPTC